MSDTATEEPETANGIKADRRRLRGAASAQRIIDATIRVIAEDGIGAVTMQRIAQKVGSSNSLVVFHFGTKENLLRAVIQHLSDQFDLTWQRLVNAPGLTTTERLLGALDCARHFARQHPDWVAVWVMVGSDRQTMQIDRMISHPLDLAYLDQARALVREIAESGGYAGVDPDVIAVGLNYLVQGAWYWDNINFDAADDDMLRRTAMLLLHSAFPRHFPSTDWPRASNGVAPS